MYEMNECFTRSTLKNKNTTNYLISHQYHTGFLLTLGRRTALLANMTKV